MSQLSRPAFFLMSDGRQGTLAHSKILLDIFALVDTYAQTQQQRDPPIAYKKAAGEALLRIQGFAASAGGAGEADFDTLDKALLSLFSLADLSRADEQLAFIKKAGLLNDPAPSICSPHVGSSLGDEEGDVTHATAPELAVTPLGSAVNFAFYVGSVTRAASPRATPTGRLWMAFAEWLPAKPGKTRLKKPTSLKGGKLRWHITTAILNDKWFEANKTQWAKMTERVNGDRIRQSGKLLTLNITQSNKHAPGPVTSPCSSAVATPATPD